MCSTHVRPYTSESGAKNRGPTAKDKRNTLKIRAVIVGSVIW